MLREDKHELVAQMHDLFNTTGGIVVAHYKGMSVAEMNEMRAKMREVGAGVQVTKNKLTQIALKATPFEEMQELFKGPTAMIYAEDAVAVAKTSLAYAKGNDKFVIVGGGLPGQAIDPKGVEALSKMPSIEELRSKLLGVLIAPATKIVSVLPQPATKTVQVLAAPARDLVGVFKAYSQKEAA